MKSKRKRELFMESGRSGGREGDQGIYRGRRRKVKKETGIYREWVSKMKRKRRRIRIKDSQRVEDQEEEKE